MKKEVSKDVINKFQNTCATTFKEVMLSWFVPLQKISGNSVIYKEFKKNNNKLIVSNEFGTTELRNRLLCEYHVSVLVAIIKHSDLLHQEDGSIVATFREIDVMREVGIGDKNYARFRELIKEIADAQFYYTVGIKSKRVSIFRDHIILNGSKAKIEGVVFHPDYVGVNKNDFSVNFKSINEKIYNIPYPTIPTIIKYIYYSYKNLDICSFELMDILKEIGFPINSTSSIKTIKSNLSKYSKILEDDFDIKYRTSNKNFYVLDKIQLEQIPENEKKTLQIKNYISRTIIYEGLRYTIEKIEKDKDAWKVFIVNKKIEKKTIEFSFLDDLLFHFEYLNSGKSINTLL